MEILWDGCGSPCQAPPHGGACAPIMVGSLGYVSMLQGLRSLLFSLDELSQSSCLKALLRAHPPPPFDGKNVNAKEC